MLEPEVSGRITNVDLTNQMRNSFLDYAMSVIVSRALPDIRDGMKPVQRRILYGMDELGLTPDKPYKKSARIVGDVMGKFHPHGDSSIYEGLVRMAQDFSYRYMLVDGHGNFGSVDGDSAAAMRYTEARMSKIALEMLRDINKDTVNFQDNYDGTEKEPEVLPARFPNILVNGASGIAVGMATNIPTHNLKEVISAIHLLMEHPDATVAQLMEALPGPDFPTGGVVIGRTGIRQAYETGRGSIIIRAKVEVAEQKNGKQRIVVHELPYMVNKARLIERIAELAREKEIDGITNINDETDQEGMRIVIDLRRDANAELILNNLYKMTLMQTTYNFNMLAIVNHAPKILSLKEILQYYLSYQREVIRRRTAFELRKSRDRAHIVAGLRIALDHVNAIVSTVQRSESSELAKQRLVDNYHVSDRQARAILDLRLVRLTNLEREKVEKEYQKLAILIADYEDILANPERINQIIYSELLEIQDKFGDARRTELQIGNIANIADEDLIEEEEVVITLTHNGYIKRSPASEFKVQGRGGHGVRGMAIHDDDFIAHLVSASTHETLFFFTNTGRVFAMKGYEVPEYGRTAYGIPIVNLLNIAADESISAILSTSQVNNRANEELFFATRHGIVKRTSIASFRNIQSNGKKVINLRNDDELVSVFVTSSNQGVVLGTHFGYACAFKVADVRSMSRTAMGVRGIRLHKGDYLVGAAPFDSSGSNTFVLAISEKGYGKRTLITEYQLGKRGRFGVKTAKLTSKNGPLVSLAIIRDDEDLMLATNKGMVIRFDVDTISVVSRVTLGVRLISLALGDQVAAVSGVKKEASLLD